MTYERIEIPDGIIHRVRDADGEIALWGIEIDGTVLLYDEYLAMKRPAKGVRPRVDSQQVVLPAVEPESASVEPVLAEPEPEPIVELELTPETSAPDSHRWPSFVATMTAGAVGGGLVVTVVHLLNHVG